MTDTTNVLAFDLEIATPIQDDGWKDGKATLGISCAATLSSSGESRLWYGQEDGGEYAPRMNRGECLELLAYLESFDGRVLTWNGLSFDFHVLAQETGELERCAALALRHIDPAFLMLCSKGFMVGLDAAARGMKVQGKTEGMHGDLAPILWTKGKEEQDKVLSYVAQDVQATLNVYQAITKSNRLDWTSRSGKWNTWFLPKDALTVQQALALPEPDTSWMSEPRTRKQCMEWIP